jgi:hypothetical protein
MELVSHGAHMHEMLYDVGREYKRIRANPPKAGTPPQLTEHIWRVF